MKRIAVLMFLLFAACGGDDDRGATTTLPDAPSVTTTTDSPGTTVDTPDRFARTPVSVAPQGAQATLTDVRVGKHDGFVRVVFEFDSLPGYAVTPAEPPFTQDGSGNEIAVAGDGFLTIRFESARAHDEEGKPTVSTARTKGPSGGSVVEVVPAGDFEGVVNYVIGLSGDHAFSVDALTSRHLLVVDIQT